MALRLSCFLLMILFEAAAKTGVHQLLNFLQLPTALRHCAYDSQNRPFACGKGISGE